MLKCQNTQMSNGATDALSEHSTLGHSVIDQINVGGRSSAPASGIKPFVVCYVCSSTRSRSDKTWSRPTV